MFCGANVQPILNREVFMQGPFGVKFGNCLLLVNEVGDFAFYTFTRHLGWLDLKKIAPPVELRDQTIRLADVRQKNKRESPNVCTSKEILDVWTSKGQVYSFDEGFKCLNNTEVVLNACRYTETRNARKGIWQITNEGALCSLYNSRKIDVDLTVPRLNNPILEVIYGSSVSCDRQQMFIITTNYEIWVKEYGHNEKLSDVLWVECRKKFRVSDGADLANLIISSSTRDRARMKYLVEASNKRVKGLKSKCCKTFFKL